MENFVKQRITINNIFSRCFQRLHSFSYTLQNPMRWILSSCFESQTEVSLGYSKSSDGTSVFWCYPPSFFPFYTKSVLQWKKKKD